MRVRLAALVLAAAAVAPPAFGQEGNWRARIDSIFAPYDKPTSPGCAVGVIRDGGLVFKRGYGSANLEHGIPLTPTNIFDLASTSKQFTAATILLLAEEGKLSLDDDIRRFLPELRDYGAPVTIRHLIHHTSGIRDYLTLQYLAGKRDDDFYTPEDVVRLLAKQRELNFDPGDEHLYSNSGYFLLSQIVRRATGQTLREYAAEKIFQPLGMAHTHFHDDHTHIVPSRATGYAPADGDGFRISMTTLDMVGDGNVYTTVEDLLAWDRNFYQPVVGGTRFLEALQARGRLNNGDTLDYASGLVHGTYRGLRTVGHGGSFVGYRSQMMRFPDHRFTVICLCNLSTANPARLARQVADVFLGDVMTPVAPEAPPGDGPVTPGRVDSWTPGAAELRAFEGDFHSDELDVVYRIRLERDSLVLTVGNDLDGALRPADREAFRRRNVVLRFARDGGGRVAGFGLEAGRVKNLRFVRRP